MTSHEKRFYCTCVDWPAHDVYVDGGLCDMVDSGREIKRRTFMRHVDMESLASIEESLGYPVPCKPPLTMAADYAVRYYTGRLHGETVVWFTHSAVEYVFTSKTADCSHIMGRAA